jgi:hypothetical protein
MTRSTKSLFSILAVLTATAATAVPAMGDSSFIGSPDAIVRADDVGGPSPQADGGTSSFIGSPDALVRAEGIGSSSPQIVANSNDGFDWGDAAIGSAIGLVLAGLLGAAITITRRRGGTVQPSV